MAEKQNKQKLKADKRAPLIIWLNGGPGASSSLGNFVENGPYALQAPKLELKVNAKGWQEFGHLLYFDQPVGTGFSHCGDGAQHHKDDCYVTDMDQMSEDFYGALQSWYAKFPEHCVSCGTLG